MKTIDQEQRRYEIAKEVFPSLLNVGKKFNENFAATLAINCADVLINRLKKSKGGQTMSKEKAIVHIKNVSKMIGSKRIKLSEGMTIHIQNELVLALRELEDE